MKTIKVTELQRKVIAALQEAKDAADVTTAKSKSDGKTLYLLAGLIRNSPPQAFYDRLNKKDHSLLQDLTLTLGKDAKEHVRKRNHWYPQLGSYLGIIDNFLKPEFSTSGMIAFIKSTDNLEERKQEIDLLKTNLYDQFSDEEKNLFNSIIKYHKALSDACSVMVFDPGRLPRDRIKIAKIKLRYIKLFKEHIKAGNEVIQKYKLVFGNKNLELLLPLIEVKTEK